MPFISNTNEIVGELDGGSPTIRLEFLINGVRSERTCHIDTGCGDEVVVTDFDFATKNMGLRLSQARGAPRVERHLADGSTTWYLFTTATLDWFAPRVVTFLAPDPRLTRTPASGQQPLPLILLGVPLMMGTTMTMNFATGAVRITPPPPGYHPPVRYDPLG